MENRVRKSRHVSLLRKWFFKSSCLFNGDKGVVWLVGDGRSGTTWVSNLINHLGNFRVMFEPFHPKFGSNVNFIEPYQYLGEHVQEGRIIDFASGVFRGKHISKRVNNFEGPIFCEGVLVKDVFANLLCYQVSRRFPRVKVILLLRNPFAVAISKQRKLSSGYYWVADPLELLDRENLYQDYLYPFEGIIRKTSAKGNFLLNQVLVWAIINHIPLRQFAPGEIHVCFYENVYADPVGEVAKIFGFTQGPGEPSGVNISREAITRPSRVTSTEGVYLSGASPVTSWRDELDPALIDEGLTILNAFGFGDLYDTYCMPVSNALDRLRKSYGSLEN